LGFRRRTARDLAPQVEHLAADFFERAAASKDTPRVDIDVAGPFCATWPDPRAH
jgi:hypothetical protein